VNAPSENNTERWLNNVPYGLGKQRRWIEVITTKDRHKMFNQNTNCLPYRIKIHDMTNEELIESLECPEQILLESFCLQRELAYHNPAAYEMSSIREQTESEPTYQ